MVGTSNPGIASTGLIERRSGTSWRLVAGPSIGGGTVSSALSGIAVAAPASAWAVGAVTLDGVITETLIEHWNGTSWRRIRSPNPGGAPGVSSLAAVSALSRSGAWAVGSYLTCSYCEPMYDQTLTEHWNGKDWRHVPSPGPGPADSFLLGVSALPSSRAWAVGSYTNPGGYYQTLERWNGTAWTQLPSPNPGGPTRSNILYGVAAVSPSSAWAVGTYFRAGADQTLIEHWDGSTWKRIPSPNPGGPAYASFLSTVAASGPSSAWAAGFYVSGGGPD